MTRQCMCRSSATKKCHGKEDEMNEFEFDKCHSGLKSFKIIKTTNSTVYKKAIAAKKKCDTTKMSYEWYSDRNCTNFDPGLTKKYGDLNSQEHAGLDGRCTTNSDQSYRATCDDKAMYVHIYLNTKCEGKEARIADHEYGKCISGTKLSFKL